MAFALDDIEQRWEIDLDEIEDATVGGDRLFVIADNELLAYG